MYDVVFVMPYGHELSGHVNRDLQGTRIRYIQNLPEDHSHHDSLFMCGLEIAELHSDEKLTYDQIRYAVSRIRTSADITYPTGNLVTIWKVHSNIHVGILGETFVYEYEKTDRVKWHEWLEENVEKLHNYTPPDA